MSEHKSFFSTLPGILTGLAALITAMGGLIFALSETGVLTPSKTEQPVTENNIQKVTPNIQEHIQSNQVKHPLEQTTDGWAIIGKVKGGKYSNLSLMVHGDSPAIGQRYDAVKDFRLVQKRSKSSRGSQQTITLGMVHRGDTVEVLDIFIPTPSTESVFVWAKLRAVLHKR